MEEGVGGYEDWYIQVAKLLVRFDDVVAFIVESWQFVFDDGKSVLLEQGGCACEVAEGGEGAFVGDGLDVQREDVAGGIRDEGGFDRHVVAAEGGLLRSGGFSFHEPVFGKHLEIVRIDCAVATPVGAPTPTGCVTIGP